MNLKFYRNEDNRWYVDLPEWEGSKDDLEMVCGADSLLDIISWNYFDALDYVRINVTEVESTERVSYKLVLDTILDSGAIYYVHNKHLEPFEIWLCDVTKFVFNGEFPKTIYFEI